MTEQRTFKITNRLAAAIKRYEDAEWRFINAAWNSREYHELKELAQAREAISLAARREERERLIAKVCSWCGETEWNHRQHDPPPYWNSPRYVVTRAEWEVDFEPYIRAECEARTKEGR